MAVMASREAAFAEPLSAYQTRTAGLCRLRACLERAPGEATSLHRSIEG